VTEYEVPESTQAFAYKLVDALISVRDHDVSNKVQEEARYSLKAIEGQILDQYFVNGRHFHRAESYLLSFRVLAKYPHIFKLEARPNLGDRKAVLEN
jgi:glutathione S-transferase